MDTKNLEIKVKKDFNNAICIMSIIPFLAFMYLLIGKLFTIEILVGEIGYIMLILMLLALMGIYMGRKVIWMLIEKLINFSHQIMNMQQELIEKNRLAAITETVLTLGHEINNPLVVVQGNLELLEGDFVEHNLPLHLKNRLGTVKSQCERIMQVTQKLSSLSKPVQTQAYDDAKMIDLGRSE